MNWLDKPRPRLEIPLLIGVGLIFVGMGFITVHILINMIDSTASITAGIIVASVVVFMWNTGGVS